MSESKKKNTKRIGSPRERGTQTTTNISMPKALRAFVDERLEQEGFGNVSEYFRSLVRRDREQQEERRLRMRALIEQGERSGKPIAAADDFWRGRQSEIRRRSSPSKRRAG